MTEMHNCKDTKKNLVEMALSGWMPIPDELANCPQCRDELTALQLTSQIADAAMRVAQPDESFWTGYHSRLRQRLTSDAPLPGPAPGLSGPAAWLRAFGSLSIPVPAPLALATFALVAFSIFFALHARTKTTGAPAVVSPTVVDRIVEVPVIQDRQITRVVYRDRRSVAPQSGLLNATQSTAARKRDVQVTPMPESLDGFKPVHEARLTLISGGRDEK
jgi:hypothetical protein